MYVVRLNGHVRFHVPKQELCENAGTNGITVASSLHRNGMLTLFWPLLYVYMYICTCTCRFMLEV